MPDTGPSWAIPMGAQVEDLAAQRRRTGCWCETPSLSVVAAARRIKAELARADEGNYGRHGWAGYISREDVETVAKAVAG